MTRVALRSVAGLALGVVRVRPALASCILLTLAAAFVCPPAQAVTPTPIAASTPSGPCTPPDCTISGDMAICQGQSTEFCGPSGNLSYLWNTGATTQCIHPNTTGTYTLTVTDLETECSSQCSKDLQVNPAPVCTITGPDSICEGQSAELCGPEGDYTYLWSTGSTARCIVIETEDTYTLTVTDPATGCSSTSGSSSVPTRTGWQMHDGLEVTPDNPLGLVAFNCTPDQHGDPCEYDVATIPQQADPGWRPAPDPNIINFSIPSRVCQAPIQCSVYGDFTYFQTFVDVPSNVSVTEFTITFSGMDDGSRVTIFNSAYPAGLVVPGSYVFLNGTGTTNLAPYVVAGEVNRVVITQVDDCCSENNLRSAIVVLNGQAVTAACGKFVRVNSCGTPPAAIDAFPIFDNDLEGGDRLDSVMVVFDRPVEKTSAENVANYFLDSEGQIDGVQRLEAPEDNRVVLQIRNQQPDGVLEGITVKGVRSLEGGARMPASMSRTFYNGVLELDEIDAPDPVALALASCVDQSRFLTPPDAADHRVSFTGTVTAAFGDLYTLQDVPGQRAGLWVRLPGTSLVPGHAYLMAGRLQEFEGETQADGIVYVRDLGTGPSLVPAIQSIRVLTDDTCDETQRFLTGADYDGMLVTVDRVEIIDSQPAGASFRVGIPGTLNSLAHQGLTAGPQDQILIASQGGNFTTFTATAGEIVTVTGVLGRVDGAFAIFPPSDHAIVGYGSVPTFSLPLDVSKSATQARDPDIVRDVNGRLFMAWWRVHHETVHSLSLDNTLNWSAAVPVMHQGAQPALAVTPSNKIGVLAAGTESLFFKQSTDGGFQMDPLVTSVDGYPTRYPAMTVGLDEHFHAAWERMGADPGVFYSRSLAGGADFSTPLAIARNGAGDENSMARICASAQDHVLVFWQYDQPGNPGVHRVLYRRSINAGVSFDPARRVRDESNPLTSTVKLAFLADAQRGPDGTVYVMGLDEAGGIAFLRSANDGVTFGLAGYLPEPAARGGLCPKSFAVGADGKLHALIGVCGTALYYTRSDDGGATWSPAVNVSSASSPTVGEPRGAKIILDGTGTPVIVWFSTAGGSTEIYSTRLLN